MFKFFNIVLTSKDSFFELSLILWSNIIAVSLPFLSLIHLLTKKTRAILSGPPETPTATCGFFSKQFIFFKIEKNFSSFNDINFHFYIQGFY